MPLGCGITLNNLGFHAPLNHPGFPNDGTQGDAGFSNAAWTSNQTSSALSWSSETFAQNQNANALRWGTLYNFRFDSNRPPQAANATIGFFKTGTPMTVGIQGPSPDVLHWDTHANSYGPTYAYTYGDRMPPPPFVCPSPFPTATATAAASPTPTPTSTPTATPCAGAAFAENFDGVVAPDLPPGWDGNWVTSTITPDTAPNDAFVADPDVLSDKTLGSPFTITSALAQVSFRNFYNLEASGGQFYDGGALEISISGGAFADIITAGGSFVTGGYNATISTGFASPIAGRQAWSGNSGGYINTVVRLGPNTNGQTVQLKFRMVSDNEVAGVGWRIDTVTSVGGMHGSNPTPTPTPTATTTPTPTGTPLRQHNFEREL